MLLIDCKVELSLKWYDKYTLSSGRTAATFAITDTKPYIPVVTLKTKNNAKLWKLLNEGFKRPVYRNKYKVILKDYAANNYIREQLDASFWGVNRLFVLVCAYGNNNSNEDAYRKYFLPRLKIENHNIEFDGRKFYDQPINDIIRQYNEIRKMSTEQCDDYTTGCLLDFAYFEKNYKLIAADLSKQKALDANSRAIEQIIFTWETDNQIRVFYVLEQSTETMLEFAKGITKVF